MPKVSVIVPVYKVEPFIGKCARSLCAQTLEDIELVFVDDASPDRSMDILSSVLEEYPQRAGQVRMLRMPFNSGLPAVRKAGFEASTGEYVIHCDSDDWLEETLCARMWETADTQGADVVVCDYFAEIGGETVRKDACGDPDRDLIGRVLTGEVPGYTWNKLVRRSLFERVACWPAANMWEDKVLALQHLYHSGKTVFLHEALYHYRISGAGMCLGEQARSKVSQLQDNVSLILSFLEEKGLTSRYGREISALKAQVQMNALPLPRREYRQVYPENRWRQLGVPELPLPVRLGHLTKLLGIHGISKVFRRA